MLYMLQRIDSGLTRKKRRYREVQAHLGEDQALRKAQAALKAAQDELSQWRARLHDHELEAAGVVDKIKETEDSMYSGRVTNPKELGDLQHEVEYLKRRQAALEDKELEEMEVVEQLTTKAAVAQEEYVVAESTWRTENAELGAEYETLKRELAKLLGQRKAVVKHISAKDMDEYDALRRLCKGVAIVQVKDGTCQVCHVEVPQRDLEKAKETDETYYCSGCERIIYVADD
jgi:predicted  nucleic acid-binding Zn-ribbon protein